jgi:hypothetical protein
MFLKGFNDPSIKFEGYIIIPHDQGAKIADAAAADIEEVLFLVRNLNFAGIEFNRFDSAGEFFHETPVCLRTLPKVLLFSR